MPQAPAVHAIEPGAQGLAVPENRLAGCVRSHTFSRRLKNRLTVYNIKTKVCWRFNGARSW